MITVVSGSMFDQHYDVRVNTVNCEGVMGKGIALEFKKLYPAMFQDYRKRCLRGLRPGQLHVWTNGDSWIINLPTKDRWRNKSRLGYLVNGLEALADFLRIAVSPDNTVAVPALGCNNGGLVWSDVRPLIERKLIHLPHKIDVFKPGEQ